MANRHEKLIQILTYEVAKAHISNLVNWAEVDMDDGLMSDEYKDGNLSGLRQAKDKIDDLIFELRKEME